MLPFKCKNVFAFANRSPEPAEMEREKLWSVYDSDVTIFKIRMDGVIAMNQRRLGTEALRAFCAYAGGEAVTKELVLAWKRQLVEQGGVLVNDEKVPNAQFAVTEEQLRQGVKIRKGKKVFHKAVLA